jgi:tripartite-type tricarboxylate transporter receptor subunit TctC
MFQALTAHDPVPYKGAAPAIADLMGNQVDLLCDQTTNTTRRSPPRRSGLCRDHQTPDHACTQGPAHAARIGSEGLQRDHLARLYAPKGTPAAVLAKINDGLKASLKDPSSSSARKALGAVLPPTTAPTCRHKKFVKSEIAKWGKVIKAAGIYAD